MLQGEEAGRAKCIVQGRIVILPEDIQIVAQCSAQKLGLQWDVVNALRCSDEMKTDHLGNDRDIGAQRV